MIPISPTELRSLAPHARPDYLAAFASSDSILADHGINDTSLRLCHFFAQILTESGDLELCAEDLDYSAQRLCAVWPKHFASLADAASYAHNPEKLGNFIYGPSTSIGKSLGNTEPTDGYMYRGHGLLQTTGRGAYSRYGKALSAPLLAEPDLACGAQWCLALAAAEWAASGYHGRTCNGLADDDDIVAVTFAINGGQNGIADRRRWLARCKNIWLIDEAEAVAPAVAPASRALAGAGMANELAA